MPTVISRLFLALVLVCAACSGALKAKVDLDEASSISPRQTYAWITDELILIQSGKGDPQIRTVENERRIRDAVDRRLGEKGYVKADSAEADFIVAFTVGTQVRYKLEGLEGRLGGVASAEPGGTYTKGTLTIYMFDRRSQKQVWQASTSKRLEGKRDPDQVVNEAVTVLINEFPAN